MAYTEAEIATYWTNIHRAAMQKRQACRYTCIVAVISIVAVLVLCDLAGMTPPYRNTCVYACVIISFALINWMIFTAQQSTWIVILCMPLADGIEYARRLAVAHNGPLTSNGLASVMGHEYARNRDWNDTMRTIQTVIEIWK